MADLDLDGKLLVAMPGMGDPRFDRAVILMCAHSAEGAMGLIVNRPTPDLTFANLLEQLSIPRAPEALTHAPATATAQRGRLRADDRFRDHLDRLDEAVIVRETAAAVRQRFDAGTGKS